MKDYEIAQVSGQCCVTQRTLEAGQEFYATLFETPQGFERRDYSLPAWQGPPENCFSFWKSRVPRKDEKKRLYVDNEVMIDLFLRLADIDDQVKQHFRFVLALILMRKRLLKYEQTLHKDGAEYWQMRLTGRQSIHQVLNPRMTDQQIEAVSGELGAILYGDAQALQDMDRSEPQTAEDATGETPLRP